MRFEAISNKVILLVLFAMTFVACGPQSPKKSSSSGSSPSPQCTRNCLPVIPDEHDGDDGDTGNEDDDDEDNGGQITMPDGPSFDYNYCGTLQDTVLMSSFFMEVSVNSPNQVLALTAGEFPLLSSIVDNSNGVLQNHTGCVFSDQASYQEDVISNRVLSIQAIAFDPNSIASSSSLDSKYEYRDCGTLVKSGSNSIRLDGVNGIYNLVPGNLELTRLKSFVTTAEVNVGDAWSQYDDEGVLHEEVCFYGNTPVDSGGSFDNFTFYGVSIP